MIALVAVALVGATPLAGRADNRGHRPVPGLLARTIIPIVGGIHHRTLFFFSSLSGATKHRALLAGGLDCRTAVTPAVNYGLAAPGRG
jgi:hypothetical protein